MHKIHKSSVHIESFTQDHFFFEHFKQLLPIVKSLLVSEYDLTTVLALIKRMIKAGILYEMLITRYRLQLASRYRRSSQSSLL